MRRCAGASWFAVYSRSEKRQSFAGRGPAFNKSSAIGVARDRLVRSRRSIVLGWLALSIGATNQAANAERHDSMNSTPSAILARDKDEIARAALAELEGQLHCRSSIDGSNAGMVGKVKAALAEPDEFSHIATTFWPREDGFYDIDMIYRMGTDPGSSEIREAHGQVDGATCNATLH